MKYQSLPLHETPRALPSVTRKGAPLSGKQSSDVSTRTRTPLGALSMCISGPCPRSGGRAMLSHLTGSVPSAAVCLRFNYSDDDNYAAADDDDEANSHAISHDEGGRE